MNRYIVFGFDQYYPSGGSGDIRNTCDDRGEADKACVEVVESHKNEYAEVWDHEIEKTVATSDELMRG